jgi:hypothetical protein
MSEDREALKWFERYSDAAARRSEPRPETPEERAAREKARDALLALDDAYGFSSDCGLEALHRTDAYIAALSERLKAKSDA